MPSAWTHIYAQVRTARASLWRSMPRVRKDVTNVTQLVLPSTHNTPQPLRRSSRTTKRFTGVKTDADAEGIPSITIVKPQAKGQAASRCKVSKSVVSQQSTDTAVNSTPELTPAAPRPNRKAGTRKRKAASLAATDYESPDALSVIKVRRDRGLLVGAHMSTSGGLERAVINAVAVGATAFAMDLRSKRKWESPPLTPEAVQAFKTALQTFGYDPAVVVPHGSYLINLGSPKPEVLEKSRTALVDELDRAGQLGLSWYNIHPGSSCGEMDDDSCMQQIAAELSTALRQVPRVTLLLESTAGQGSCVGHRFEHLRYIMDRVDKDVRSRVAVCLDTCHMYAAGYDIASSKEAFDAVLHEFDEVVGLNLLKAVHVNDSKTALGSRKDRHENLGKGHMGLDCFKWLINDPRLRDVVMIMETPCQVMGPSINYPASCEKGVLVLRELEADVGENTDKQDITLLCGLRHG